MGSYLHVVASKDVWIIVLLAIVVLVLLRTL